MLVFLTGGYLHLAPIGAFQWPFPKGITSWQAMVAKAASKWSNNDSTHNLRPRTKTLNRILRPWNGWRVLKGAGGHPTEEDWVPALNFINHQKTRWTIPIRVGWTTLTPARHSAALGFFPKGSLWEVRFGSSQNEQNKIRAPLSFIPQNPNQRFQSLPLEFNHHCNPCVLPRGWILGSALPPVAKTSRCSFFYRGLLTFGPYRGLSMAVSAMVNGY